ncbi:MAG TPA: response regulator [Coleofasciculaceae cyanobacterium]
MNKTILLVENNPDDQFLIQRALNKRALNQTNLVGVWSKPIEKIAQCNSPSLNKLESSYPSVLSVCEHAELVVSVELVENKEEAANYLKGKNYYGNRERYPLPVLIVISVAMPHLSGLSLLAWLKRQPELLHIPVVMVSDIDKKEQAMNLGAIAYIFKTLCFTSLTEVVRTLLLLPSMKIQEQCQDIRHAKKPLNLVTPLSANLLARKRAIASSSMPLGR